MNIMLGRPDLNWQRLRGGDGHEKTGPKSCPILSGAPTPFICGLHPKIRFSFYPSTYVRFAVVQQILVMETYPEWKGKFKPCPYWLLQNCLTQLVLGSAIVLMPNSFMFKSTKSLPPKDSRMSADIFWVEFHLLIFFFLFKNNNQFRLGALDVP